jgi:hypothetical protein
MKLDRERLNVYRERESVHEYEYGAGENLTSRCSRRGFGAVRKTGGATSRPARLSGGVRLRGPRRPQRLVGPVAIQAEVSICPCSGIVAATLPSIKTAARSDFYHGWHRMPRMATGLTEEPNHAPWHPLHP